MKVRFAADVLEDARAWQILDRIVDHFVAQRHLWAIEEPDTIIESSWIQTDLDLGGRAGRANLEACQKCYTDTIYASQQSHVHMITLIVTYQGHNPYELTPDDAQQALNAPAYVVVENADSDGRFWRP